MSNIKATYEKHESARQEKLKLKLTKPQAAALVKLIGLKAAGFKHVMEPGYFPVVPTGLNTATLCSLRDKGLIVGKIFTRGRVQDPDVTTLGHLAVDIRPHVLAADVAAPEPKPATSGRCDCYNGHDSNSGRCQTRNVTDPTRVEGQAAFCEECRKNCRPGQ